MTEEFGLAYAPNGRKTRDSFEFDVLFYLIFLMLVISN